MLVVVLILMGSIWAITSLLSLMTGSELVRTAEDTNFTVNSRAASGIEERLYELRSAALLLLDMGAAAEGNTSLDRQLRNAFFERNPHIVAVIVPGSRSLINQQFFSNYGVSLEALNAWLTAETGAIERAEHNVPVLRNLAPDLGVNLLALFYPWQSTGVEESVVVFFSPQHITEVIAAGSSSTMVVNGDGDVLVHPDFSQVLTGANVSGRTFFTALKKESGETVRVTYTEGGNRFIAAGQRISLADACVFSTLEYSFITQQLAVISRRSVLISGVVLFFAILVTWFFTKSITNPVKRLMAAAARIKMGEFYLDLKVKSRDEIGELTGRFIDMGQGLSEWEEKRDLVGHYNSREIINRVMRGELNLAGEYLKAVILAVDFISFPSVSANLKAEDSLELLNSFMAKMINCIEKTDGVVDKLLGSRIIALWGIPLSSGDFSAEVMKSLNSSLMMRDLVSEMNSDRDGQALVQMACGIHWGEVLAGRIGAFRHNKYTVIGTNIDTAIECCEACGPTETDIVISKAVRDLVSGRILAEDIKLPKNLKSGISMFRLVNISSAQDKME